MEISLLIFLAACFVAYANGANDNFKGVATLFGSGTTNYKRALGWATVTTFAGSVSSLVLAESLIKSFSGERLVPDTIAGSPNFIFAIALGAGLTVMLATLTGFPISTTHGLIGALVGSGLAAVGTQINIAFLGNSFFLPLLVSPLIAATFGSTFYRLFTLDTEEKHMQNCTGKFWGKDRFIVLDSAHYLSAGLVCFARGLNDTPKIVALLLAIKALDVPSGIVVVTIAMAAGGLLNAKKVAETMSHKITPLNHSQGFTANIVTSVLVIFASQLGMPVSTTHVSVGSLFGIGLITGKANDCVVRNILLSWILTLPIAAILSAMIYWILRSI